MRTIVGRLTAGYALALAATMFVFAATIFLVQTPEPYSDIDERLSVEADLIGNIIVSSAALDPVITKDSSGAEVLSDRVGQLLQTVEDYVVVVDTGGSVWYAEGPAATVTMAGDTLVITGAGGEPTTTAGSELDSLARVAQAAGPVRGFGVHHASSPIGAVRFYTRPLSLGTREAMILTAARSGNDVAGRILTAMLAIGPIILLASILVVYLGAGRTLKPMDVIIDEIEAITDGRSLHRRVVELKNTEELERLSTTLNSMLVRLERSFMSLRRFTADASHELKTPLTVLRSSVERAITHPDAPPSVLEMLEESLVEVNRMTELVDSLLMLARADEGRAPLHLESVDIRGVLAEVNETASILGEQAQVFVSVAMPDNPIYLAMDRSRVRQLFMNLLTNAIKYTPKGGKVSIECRRSDGDLLFQVSDTGIGIASSELPHIFDRFWRADRARSRTSQRPGAGLGLAICKWIAEAHGGTISVESRRGEGSTFTVKLPLGEGAPTADSTGGAEVVAAGVRRPGGGKI
jgi:signal transduction histidine kinase